MPRFESDDDRAEFFEFLQQEFGFRRICRASKTRFCGTSGPLRSGATPTGSSPRSSSTRPRACRPNCSRKLGSSPISRRPGPLAAAHLVGQPELADRLNDPRLRQLKQRIALRCELTPLDLRETAAYIAARVRSGRQGRTTVHARGRKPCTTRSGASPDHQRHLRQRARQRLRSRSEAGRARPRAGRVPRLPSAREARGTTGGSRPHTCGTCGTCAAAGPGTARDPTCRPGAHRHQGFSLARGSSPSGRRRRPPPLSAPLNQSAGHGCGECSAGR